MENGGFPGLQEAEKVPQLKDVEASAGGGAGGILFSWSSLTVSTPADKGTRCCGLAKAQPKPSKMILTDVTGQARPGEVLAIMGASGAGKSTLLNTLLFRNTEGLQVTGKRIANGRLVTPTSLTSVAGYVQQEDLFIGTLTVREQLVFQSRVGMDRGLGAAARKDRVEQVIKELGLSKAAETMIGIPGRIQGISGGERKRLAVASEILTDPAVLFCDEPTSGLDSHMAASVVDLLRGLASQGKTVICTIHQPSSQVFTSFDRLLLLAEGRTAYLGPTREAKLFFSLQGFPCPEDFNPADHLVSVLAVVPGQEEEDRARVAQLCTAFRESEGGPAVARAVAREEEAVEEQDEEVGGTMAASPYAASWGQQFCALAWRNSLNTIKDPMVARVKIIQSIVLGLILGFIFLQQENDQKGIQNKNGALFVLLTNTSFGNIFAVVNVFCSELPVFRREHFNGLYRTDVYFLAKQVVDLPLFVIEPLIGVSILYWMVGLNPLPERFLMACLIVLLVVQVVLSLGYFMSCSFSNVDVALAIAPVVIIPFMLFGGFFLNAASVPVWLEWLKYLSWFLWGYEAFMVNQWTGVIDIACNSQSADSGQACLTTGEAVLDQLSFQDSNLSLSLGMLVVLAVVLRLLALLVLLVKNRRKG